MKSLILSILCLSPLVSISQEAEAKVEVEIKKEKEATDFLRVHRTEKATQLQTGITTYVKDGITVDLIGAIHIADEKYYQQLNKEFTNYDTLLFEMVGGEGIGKEAAKKEDAKKKKEKDAQFNFLGSAYKFMANRLDLVGQQDGINYLAKNFVHADLTIKEFNDLQKEKGESLLKLALASAKKKKDAKVAEPDGMKLLKAMLMGDSDGMKLAMIDTLGAGDDEVGALAGSDSVIIGDRNIKCLEVLEEQVTLGKKKLGIFYGAAHFPDMEERMLKMGYKQTAHRWLNAWDITNKVKKEKKKELPAEEKKAA